ncbi:MAG: hypothetical protein AAF468_06925 [Pseudomonadota bacterium]
MSEKASLDPEEPTAETGAKVLTLKNAIKTVRDRQADRDDVVVDMKEAQLARIQLLGEALEDFISEIPADQDRFEFSISNGETPRLWIDMVSHVSMGPDKRTYRLLRDTRIGRKVIAETGDRDQMAEHVSHYVAEVMLERERQIEGDAAPVQVKTEEQPKEETPQVETRRSPSRFLWFVLGLAFGIAAILGYAFIQVPGAN